MSEREEILWVVSAERSLPQVFRSRSRARDYVETRLAQGSGLTYRVDRATWGPESVSVRKPR